MNLEKNIKERCHVNTNEDGDSFVGVKADTDDAIIYFPLGYSLPEDEDEIRRDIHNLFSVLSAFMKEDKLIEESKFEAPRTVDFPMHAYLIIIRNFLSSGHYYVENETCYKTDIKGSVSWPKTVKEQMAYIQKNGSPVYTSMSVRLNKPNENNKLTQIHKFCVYEAFEKLGWLYVPYMPEKPMNYPSIRESIAILEKKLYSTHNDVEQELFRAMKDMLEYYDKKTQERQYFFGTDHFDKVWELMIDKAFGVKNKEDYFPRTKWLIKYGRDKEKHPLIPDTIMIYNDKYYVLDAKFYRYGVSFKPDHLPNSSDINKQITYGDYVQRIKELPNENLYNAFLMPFNKNNNFFKRVDDEGNFIPDITENFGNVAEAVGDWTDADKYYQRIQGIVVDVRYLMYNYYAMPEKQKDILVEAIEEVKNK